MSDSRTSSAASNALLSVGSLLVFVLLLAALEGGLRLAGLGDQDSSGASALKYQQVFLPLLSSAERPDRVSILRTTDPRLPYQTILGEKPENALRVFVFGGSATAGLGFSPNVTFARHLERMLRASNPERKVEVVNLGIVALASRQVRIMVEQVCASYAPDLVVIYSGNNEFLEIHARKYADAHATFATRVAGALFDTNLYRFFARALGRDRRSASEAGQDLSHEDLRLTQDEIIRDISLAPDEVAEVIDAYAENIDGMVRATTASKTPIVLMSVASNWEWRGRQDLPADWIAELLGTPGPATPERLALAIRALDQRLENPTASERHEWLFRRATAHASLGHADAARDDYRAAMNEDPHLRRALDSANDRLRDIAERYRISYLDTVEKLASVVPNGIVGFDVFYDYVHFTPRGAILVAAAIFRDLPTSLRGDAAFDVDAYVRAELEMLAGLDEDPMAVDRWLGFGFDRAGITDRNLWKYDELMLALDARIEGDPSDMLALVYRGNAAFFRQDGAEPAERDYRAAIATGLAPPAVKRNLDTLLRERGH